MVDVVLVNEKDEVIGTEEKIKAHEKALLHRAFSIFVFNEDKELLIQRRALTKYHCPGIWANTCCSHPFLNEDLKTAGHRRLKEELGFDVKEFNYMGKFIYKAEFDNGLTEHELDHVLTAKINMPIDISPNPEEVYAYKWIKLSDLKKDIQENPEKYSPWLKIILTKKEFDI
ncbi:MAG: isopentenyl-diphosphate Delta-isomerase [Alphaproteobacteria bacterium]|nr:isopentenyl-diphosphate Delta-isomerase [Alphaproteobacteria bacterium]